MHMKNDEEKEIEEYTVGNGIKYFHGMIQFITWMIFIGICGVSVILVMKKDVQVYNILLPDSFFLTVTIAITFSHAYNYYPRPKASLLWNQASKLRATWLHASNCWQSLNIWMTIAPLYCTCIAIYLSGNHMNSGHILIHSILSLVISMGTYIIYPGERARTYLKAYSLVNEALTDYEINKSGGEKKIAKAVNEGTQITVKFEFDYRS